ncbi:hypothetical protein CNR22_12235 [Sphingobacteriaceae bacterium]|nr:hypothetical protein CNR22_12235 [Sphingobacteriaceae bacterium]
MELHKLLQNQIKNFLPDGAEKNDDFKKFIAAVQQTYATFESENEKLSKTHKCDEQEYLRLRKKQTEKKRAIEALKKSEEKYRNILERSTDVIYKTNRMGYFTFVNPVMERMTGFSAIELLNTHFSKLIREDFRKMAANVYLLQIENKQATSYLEFPIITKSGNERWIGQSVQHTQLSEVDFEMTALAIDITERKASEKTIILREEKYRNIIANIHMGLVEVDLREIIRYCNQGFCDLSGYKKEELIGKNIVDVLVSESSKSTLKNKTAQRSNGLSDIYEIEIKNKSGELRWWMVSGAPNYDDGGNLIGSIGIHLDITERKTLEQKLKISQKKAEESSQAKEAFLANMSHEIRTPLNAIIGMIRELSYENLSANQRHYVQITSTASQHLLSVLNNILDISKIEAGEFQLEMQNFNPDEVLKNVVNIMKNSASEKNLYLNATVSPDIKKTLVGDPTRIRQIFLNLLGNAVKFTQTGGVSIACELETETSTHQTILLSIKDTGIGMGENYVKNIFSKFSQEDVTTARNYGGTGLGMAITRELIQLMNGTIDVQSKRHHGTTIQIKLTLPIGQEIEVEKNSVQKKTANNVQIKVLLTEDNEFNRLVATRTLERNNFSVSIATNGAEAVKLLETEKFDVILMDLQMPVMDGITATQNIRHTLKLKTPIIALSANAFKTESDHCLSIGMNDYVTKPFEEKVLMDSIYKQLGKTEIIENAEAISYASKKLYNMDELNLLSGGDKAYMEKLVEIFIRQTNSSLKQMKEALAIKDLKTVFQISHQLKPSIDGFHIDCLKLEVREIEKNAKEGIYSVKLEKLVSYADDILNQVMNELQIEFGPDNGDRPRFEYQP